MSENDPSGLDGHLLSLFVAVAEEASVTRAAQRLDLTQSAVSHGLDRLRAITGDALFIRSGRGIAPTVRAQALLPRARTLLQDLHAFATAEGFDPAHYAGTLTIAANDLQRDLLLPTLLRRLRAQAPSLSLRVIPSDVPTPEMLRDGRCQLVISPRPPEAADLIQKRLFEDRWCVYFDPQQRRAPRDLDDYLAADHVTVVYEPHRLLDLDRVLAERGTQRRFVASAPGFAGVPAFVRGGPWLATAPAGLRDGLMRGLAHAEPPLPCPPLPVYAVWHARHQADPLHRWLRQALDAVAAEWAATSPATPLGAVAVAQPIG